MNSIRRIALGLLLVGGSVAAQSAALPDGTRFVMSHFKITPGSNVQDERLFISYSADGLNWQSLNGQLPVWEPVNAAPFTNVVRDPAIIYEGGFFWIAYTSGNYGRHASFGLVKTPDFVSWTLVGEIGTAIPGATDQLTWNPVWFRDGDGSVHLLISLSLTGGANYTPVPDMRVHEMHPLNAGFTQWSAPVLMGLPTANTNELWVWKEGATYHALYVNIATGRQLHSTSNQLLTGWSPAQILGYQGQEGGMVLPRPEGGYRLFLEPGYSGLLPWGYRTYELATDFSSLGPAQLVTSEVVMRNGKMTAAPATTHYAGWQVQYLTDLPAAQQLPTADPDGDGRTNLFEYSTALHPRNPTDQGEPRGFFLTTPSGERHLTLRYRRLPSLADVSYGLETAGAALAFTSAGGAFTPRSFTLLSDGSELVETVDDTAASSGGPRFIRLKLTLSP